LSLWPAIAFTIQGLLFLLMGLDMRSIFLGIWMIPLDKLLLYAFSIIAVVVIGRFIWVYGTVRFFPRFFFPQRNKEILPWQNLFVVSWAGMRGGVSLAAALAVPALTFLADAVDLRDFIIFIVFCVIIATLILQGLSLPYLIKKMGLDKVGQYERYREHLAELNARKQMILAALNWLQQYKQEFEKGDKLLDEIDFHINEYRMLKAQYKDRLRKHDHNYFRDEQKEMQNKMHILNQAINVEKAELLRLWQEEKINLKTRNRLLSMLDHQVQRFL
jgi:monovalent cation/hydrogen antiporter